jgi:predicted phosphodiesterase
MIDWDALPGRVITVVSDLHANKRAVKACLEAVSQKRSDQLVILGDILTYGIDTQEVMDMVAGALEKGAQLLTGNHDEMYLQLIAGYCEIFPKLRADLQESITYNLDRVDAKLFAGWKWEKELVLDNVYFSHANPYGDCWEYIKDQDDFLMAAYKIKNFKNLAGVFGHTHRAAHFSLKNGFIPQIEGLQDDVFVINPGSVGQPRSVPRQASILRLSSHENRLWAEIEPVPYDMQAHVEDLRNSSLSNFTKTKLLSHFL